MNKTKKMVKISIEKATNGFIVESYFASEDGYVGSGEISTVATSEAGAMREVKKLIGKMKLTKEVDEDDSED